MILDQTPSPILIAHRGNINGPVPDMENRPEYIDAAIAAGYDVEIDLWVGENGDFFLGHDAPQYKIPGHHIKWFDKRKQFLWVHCKNVFALQRVTLNSFIRGFYHEKEKHVLISNHRAIWTHRLDEAGQTSIIPLLSKEDFEKWVQKPVFGICSDYVSNFNKVTLEFHYVKNS